MKIDVLGWYRTPWADISNTTLQLLNVFKFILFFFTVFFFFVSNFLIVDGSMKMSRPARCGLNFRVLPTISPSGWCQVRRESGTANVASPEKGIAPWEIWSQHGGYPFLWWIHLGESWQGDMDNFKLNVFFWVFQVNIFSSRSFERGRLMIQQFWWYVQKTTPSLAQNRCSKWCKSYLAGSKFWDKWCIFFCGAAAGHDQHHPHSRTIQGSETLCNVPRYHVLMEQTA